MWRIGQLLYEQQSFHYSAIYIHRTNESIDIISFCRWQNGGALKASRILFLLFFLLCVNISRNHWIINWTTRWKKHATLCRLMCDFCCCCVFFSRFFFNSRDLLWIVIGRCETSDENYELQCAVVGVWVCLDSVCIFMRDTGLAVKIRFKYRTPAAPKEKAITLNFVVYERFVSSSCHRAINVFGVSRRAAKKEEKNNYDKKLFAWFLVGCS